MEGVALRKDQLQKLGYEHFLKSLPTITKEDRYGFALYEDDDFIWIEDLFIKLISDRKVFGAIQQLKKHDDYSYLHSIDTFILGALFAKKMNLKDIETFALGCLLHDIGKLEICKSLLQKKGVLTTKEYKEIQKHVIYGHQWLTKHQFHSLICELAQSHHERRDGTGYPDQLTKDKISNEVQMLMIIDVYSALTLPRSYHKGKSALAAIEVFLKEEKKFNQHLVHRFLEMLKIVPPTSTVLLSNHQKAKIVYVDEKQPFLPVVEIIDTKETFQLPINHSIFIKKLIQFGSKQENTLWEDYVTSLVSGQKQEAIDFFEQLIDNRRLEDIYINVISKAMEEIGARWEKGILSIAEEHVASFLTREILDYFKYRSIPLAAKKRPKIALVTVEGDHHMLPIKIASDIIEAKGWEVFNLEHPLPIDDLLNFLNNHHIDKLGISISINEALPTLHQMISDIKKSNKNITIVVGGRIAKTHQINGADIVVTDMEAFDKISF